MRTSCSVAQGLSAVCQHTVPTDSGSPRAGCGVRSQPVWEVPHISYPGAEPCSRVPAAPWKTNQGFLLLAGYGLALSVRSQLAPWPFLLERHDSVSMVASPTL